MKTYRLGNTITIRWTISLANGEPFTLNPETVELVAIAPHHSMIIDDFTVESNVLTWIFKGSEQKYLGPYTLTLIQNRGKVDMVTVDICEAFALVPWSCMAGGTDDAAGVETESLEISSTVSATQVTLSPEVEAAIKTATDPKQDKEDPTLQTKDKTIPGAINEIMAHILEYDISKLYPTEGKDGGNTYTKESAVALIQSKLYYKNWDKGTKCTYIDSDDNAPRTIVYNNKSSLEFRDARAWTYVAPHNSLFIANGAFIPNLLQENIYDIRLSKPLKEGSKIYLKFFGKKETQYYKSVLQITEVSPDGKTKDTNIVIDLNEFYTGLKTHSKIYAEDDVFRKDTEISFIVNWDFPIDTDDSSLVNYNIQINDIYCNIFRYKQYEIEKSLESLVTLAEQNKQDIAKNSESISAIGNELFYENPLAGVYFTSPTAKAREILLGVYLIIKEDVELPEKVYFNLSKNSGKQYGDLQRFYDKESGAQTYNLFGQKFAVNPEIHSGIEWLNLGSISDDSPYYNKLALYIKINWDAITGQEITQDELGCYLVPSELNKAQVDETVSLKEKVQELDLKSEQANSLVGKKIVVFGDSISEIKDSEGKSWTDYFAEKTGAEVINAGIGGSRLSMRTHMMKIKITGTATSDGTLKVSIWRGITANITTSDSIEDIARKIKEADPYQKESVAIGDTVYITTSSDVTLWHDKENVTIETTTGVTYEITQNYWPCVPEKFSDFDNENVGYAGLDIPSMVCGLVNNDWVHQKEAAEFLKTKKGDDNTSIVDRISKVNIQDVDAVLIFGGTNNYSDKSFGEAGGERGNNVSWHLERCIEELLKANNNLQIYVLTPICRYFGNDISNWDDSNWCDNHKYTGRDFIAMPTLVKAIEDVAKFWHIPVIELYYSLGWNKWNYSQHFVNTDGTHPTKGLNYLGSKIASIFKSINSL